MPRISKATLARQEYERQRALPEAPINPARLQGPDVGSAVIYHSTRDGDVPAVILERSYVWAPDKVVTMPDGSEHRGYRRYDLKVIAYGAGRHLLVDDKDLIAV